MSSLQNYDVDEAAKVLRCFPSFLRENLARLPHQKIGLAVCFDEDELAEIKAMFRVRPAPSAPGAADVPQLSQIKPRGTRRRTG
ncbi:hypothetical protein [Streptomyces sp. NPDC058612]|uniref:hypothetical protein n=1 Tax=Streptomyces sp. NPDC058612 TaxID=3346555 RepID=UPI00364755F5